MNSFSKLTVQNANLLYNGITNKPAVDNAGFQLQDERSQRRLAQATPGTVRRRRWPARRDRSPVRKAPSFSPPVYLNQYFNTIQLINERKSELHITIENIINNTNLFT